MATNAQAKVTITFVDDSETEYLVSADKGIAARIPDMLSRTGALSLWNDEESFIIMAARIHDIKVEDLPEPARAAHAGLAPGSKAKTTRPAAGYAA